MKFEQIFVFGLGAVGANIIMNLIRDLPNVKIAGIDYDKVAERNYLIGTQPYLKEQRSWLKTQALKMLTYREMGRSISVTDKEVKNQEDIKFVVEHGRDYITLDNGKTEPVPFIVIDAFDNAKSRNFFLGLNYDIVHIGFSPMMTGEVVWDPHWSSITDVPGPDICNQLGARSFIMALTSIASMVIVDYCMEGNKRNVFIDKFLNLKLW